MLKKSEVITKLQWWNLYHIIWDMRQNAQRLTCTCNILVIITSKKIREVKKKRTKLNVWPIPMIYYTMQSNNCVPVIFDFNWLPFFIKLYTQSNNYDIQLYLNQTNCSCPSSLRSLQNKKLHLYIVVVYFLYSFWICNQTIHSNWNDTLLK